MQRKCLTLICIRRRKTSSSFFIKNNEPFILMTFSHKDIRYFRVFMLFVYVQTLEVTLHMYVKRQNDSVKKVTLNFTAQLKEVQKSYSYLIIETNVRFYRAVISLRDDNLSLLLHVFKYDKMSCTLFEYLIFIGRKFCV